MSCEPQICVGGFIGVSNNANLNFTSCNNNAFIFAVSEHEGHNGVGGFLGTMVSGVLKVRDCHNIGDVQNAGDTGHAGGLIGRLSSVLVVDIDGFKNLRNINSTANFWEGVGGVIVRLGKHLVTPCHDPLGKASEMQDVGARLGNK